MTSYKSEWQEIHMQIDAIVRAIPQHFLLDPPDGGEVSVAEGVQRMAASIEKLEAALLGEETEHSRRIMEVDRLRAALRRIDRMEVYEADAHVVLWGKIGIMRDIARAALEERT